MNGWVDVTAPVHVWRVMLKARVFKWTAEVDAVRAAIGRRKTGDATVRMFALNIRESRRRAGERLANFERFEALRVLDEAFERAWRDLYA